MRDHFNLKMFLPKFFPLGKSFITIPKVVLGLQKSCTEGDQLRGGLANYMRVDTRFKLSFPKTVTSTIAPGKISDDCRTKS